MLEKIKESCHYVSFISQSVHINYEQIEKFLEENKEIKVSHWAESNSFGILDFDIEKIMKYLLALHTVGLYSFWGNPKWTIEIESGKFLDGSFAMSYILADYFRKNESIILSYDEFKNLVQGNVEVPFLKKRYDDLCDMNTILQEKTKENFCQSMKEISEDEELFELVIKTFPYLKDESIYHGNKVYFYKRAQLLVSDIFQFRRKKEGLEFDCPHLVGCADYKIPQVMRSFGFLEYSSELERMVDQEKEIPKDSDYELEIRANTIVVIDELVKRLNDQYTHMEVNDFIWLKGQDKSIAKKPYHKTRTDKY